MSVKIAGNANVIADVNADREVLIAPTQDPLKSGYVTLLAEPDDGTITGTRDVKALDMSDDYRLRVGMDSLLFQSWFNTAQDSNNWSQAVTTMTTNYSLGGLILNSGLNTATSTAAQIRSWRTFPIYGTFGASFEFLASVSQDPVANNVVEIGAGFVTGSTAPTDGAFFRLNATGEFRCVINNNGTESQSAALNFNALWGINTARHLIVVIGEDRAVFWIDDVKVAEVPRPANGSGVTLSNSLPAFVRIYNTGATASAQTIKVSMCNVTLLDCEDSKPWADCLAGMGNNGAQGQPGGTFGSTALYTNSLAPGAGAAATNTTAALGSGLGGQFSLLPTLAANTDGIISSYQVPVATATVPGKTLYIRGVRIYGIVTTILAGGPIYALWSLAFGSTNVSLATTESTAAKAPRRIPLGIQTWAATAAVGVQADRDINVQFNVPVAVYPGEFVQTVLKNVGTVTTTGVITFLVGFDAYWE